MNDQEAHDYYADPANLATTGPGYRRKRPTLTAMTAVRFAPQVIDEVKDVAFAEGITVGAWIRRLVDGELSRRSEAAFVTFTLGMTSPPPGHPRSFSCPHMSVGNVVAAGCGICGPLAAVA